MGNVAIGLLDMDGVNFAAARALERRAAAQEERIREQDERILESPDRSSLRVRYRKQPEMSWRMLALCRPRDL